MPPKPIDQRILILAPRGRDAEVMQEVLGRERFACQPVAGVAELLGAIVAGAGAAIVAEEALQDADLAALRAWLEQQEPWSDFPFVILVSKRIGMPAQPTVHAGVLPIADLGNVVMLERPLNAQTLCSATAAALRGRRRQYQAREVLADRVATAESLRLNRAELVALNETLEARIAQRTRALAQANDRLMNESIERERVQQALVQFQKMEAVGRLTGGIAHDFNNLLNVIQGSMDLILFMSKDELAIRKAEVARRACDRGAKLTSQLLAFSRNQRLDLRTTSVAGLFDGVRELISASLGSAITLRFEHDAALDCVMADMNQMEMALLNLAINARDAMPRGGRLCISARPGTPPHGLLPAGDYGVIAVTDSGEGIAPELLAKVFEPFFTTKAVGKGTGLGLSQVYGMAQQSGGSARVVSEQGVGTTVEIWLRAASVDSADEVAAAAPVATAAHGGARILVVEDDNYVRQSMVDTLEVLGYKVSQAANGEQGLRELRRETPHLMITDYLMPGMTGAELVERANSDFPGLPMLIVTGYADMQAIDAVIGDNAVLHKPFQLADLASAVERALRKHAHPELATP